jgi:uncharacterized membrane protein YbhN (UPF0104 family)
MFSIKNGRLTACFFIHRGHGSKEKEHRKFKTGLAKQFLSKPLAFFVLLLSCAELLISCLTCLLRTWQAQQWLGK